MNAYVLRNISVLNAQIIAIIDRPLCLELRFKREKSSKKSITKENQNFLSVFRTEEKNRARNTIKK